MREAVRSGAGSYSAEELLDHALVQCMRDTGANVGAVYLRSSGEHALRMTVLSGVPWEIALPWARVGLNAPTPVADALRDRRLVWLGDQQEMARHYPQLALVLPYPFTLAASAITTEATDWGGLVLQWPGSHPTELSPWESEVIGDTCHRIGLLLSMAADAGRPVVPGATPHIVPSPEARDAESAAGARVAGQPSGSLAEGPSRKTAVTDFAERLPGGCCALDHDGRTTFVTASAARILGIDASELLGARPWEVLPWLNPPAAQDSYRAAVLGRSHTSFTTVRPPGQWLFFHLYPDATGISVRILPIAGRNAPPEAAHTPALTPLADTGRTATLYHLMHLAATLTEAVGVNDVVDRAADQVLPATGAQALALMTAEEGRLRIIGHRGYPTDLIDRFDGLPLSSDSPAVHCMNTGTPSFFATFAELQRAHAEARPQDDMAAWCFLPLIASGRPLGSLVLAFDRPHPFGTSERTVLTSLAGLTAQALDRARLYDANQRLAHSLQSGLLPYELPHVPELDVAARYLPAGHGVEIGGDLYDLIRLTDTTVAATIGDVQGHSVQAATLMGQVRTAVHATAGAPPGEVLARTNRLLTDLDPGLFTSCLYAHFDLARHHAWLAGAGHPPPVLRHPDGRTEVLQLPTGLLLGIDPDATYSATEIALPPGAVLVLYTDGLVEVPGVDLDLVTQAFAERLAKAGDLDAEALADVLVQDVGRRAHRNDDVALLVIRAR